MKRSRYSEEQIIGILKEVEAGLSVADACRKHGMSQWTFIPLPAFSFDLSSPAA